MAAHRMRWTTRGSGEPVVLVHSSGMSSRQWRRLADSLASTHQVVVPDLLGYGQSTPWPEGERAHFALDQLALEALVDRVVARTGERVHIVGHSYGGFLALLVALHRATFVRSVTAYEPVSFRVLRSAKTWERSNSRERASAPSACAKSSCVAAPSKRASTVGMRSTSDTALSTRSGAPTAGTQATGPIDSSVLVQTNVVSSG